MSALLIKNDSDAYGLCGKVCLSDLLRWKATVMRLPTHHFMFLILRRTDKKHHGSLQRQRNYFIISFGISKSLQYCVETLNKKFKTTVLKIQDYSTENSRLQYWLKCCVTDRRLFFNNHTYCARALWSALVPRSNATRTSGQMLFLFEMLIMPRR